MSREPTLYDLPFRVEHQSDNGRELYELMAVCAFPELADAALEAARRERRSADRIERVDFNPFGNKTPVGSMMLLNRRIELWSLFRRYWITTLGASMNDHVCNAIWREAAVMFDGFRVIVRTGALVTWESTNREHMQWRETHGRRRGL